MRATRPERLDYLAVRQGRCLILRRNDSLLPSTMSETRHSDGLPAKKDAAYGSSLVAITRGLFAFEQAPRPHPPMEASLTHSAFDGRAIRPSILSGPVCRGGSLL